MTEKRLVLRFENNPHVHVTLSRLGLNQSGGISYQVDLVRQIDPEPGQLVEVKKGEEPAVPQPKFQAVGLVLKDKDLKALARNIELFMRA